MSSRALSPAEPERCSTPPGGNTTQVVLATLAGAGDEALDVLGGLDIAVVDEAAQATEPAAWLALLRARRAVLAGDSKQLPPTILSQEAAAQVQICC